MTDEPCLSAVENLPRHPISVDVVKELGSSEADVIHGTRPIESEFNDVVTEFLLYLDERICALVYDPDRERWIVLESRSYDEESLREVEGDLMNQLYDWRREHVIPYLVENDLVPNFVI